MTAIRHKLQKDVFLPHDERLIAVVHVTKAGKKKKTSFLCAAVTTDQPAQVSIHKVKKTDKDNYKKRQSWLLAELKLVDGKDPDIDVPDFDLHFEKVYKWIASNGSEKNSFIASIWKLTQRYLKQLKKPDFINVKPTLLEEFVSLEDQSRTTTQEDGISHSDDYQALSPREETDLERMMNECEFAIGNAEAFVEQLANDLSVLDGANIHSIIESQQSVARLMHVLDEGLREVNTLESSLDNYDQKLEGVRVHMEIMEQKDSMIQIQSQNHSKLVKELKELMDQMDIPHKYQMALLDKGVLSSPRGIMECTAAAECLQKKMEATPHLGLSKMRAVTDQQELLTNLQEKFAQRLATHLNNMFLQQGMVMGETLSLHSGRISLPKHHSFHRDLIPYSELIQWLKRADKTSFTKLAKIYTESLHKLYNKELADFFEVAKQALMKKGSDGKKNPFQKVDKGSNGDLTKLPGTKGKVPTMHELVATFKGADSDLSDHQRFDMVFTSMLNEIHPMCQAEQDFCSKFFGLGVEQDLMPQIAKDSEDFLGEELSATEIDGNLLAKKKPEDTKQVKSELSLACKRRIRAVMSDLFRSLETEMQNFTTFTERLDNFHSVYMLVRIGHQVLAPQNQAGSYLSMVLASCLVEVKRNFDKYIDNMVRGIEETRVSKKSKCGILAFVKEFEVFAEEAEMVFKGSERRGDLDKAYTKLVSAQFKAIHRIAHENQKTPRDVVIYENFHHLHAVLYRLKINVLENERKEAKQKYQEHLKLYVQESLGRPMDKLNNFFEGVETLVAQGVKAEEVGYQMAFNKQELRKVIKEYPGKEVKKGLDGLVKKVEKTLCEEENLFQVTWRSMQEEFIRQYKHIEDLIARCYPGANVNLEFSINEVLQYFSDIAQSH